MNGLYIIAALSMFIIGIMVWLWGCTGNRPKPKSLIDEEIKKNRIKRYYDGALR